MSAAARIMAAAAALSMRGAGRTAPNPSVGCIVIREGRVVGRGWTRPGGRPHAEAVALAEAGEAARGSEVFVTLEPCAHESARGPACADLLAAARPRAVFIGIVDPDPRTRGQGIARLKAAGIEVGVGIGEVAARTAMAGFLTRLAHGRPRITLKLAMSIDGRVALAGGESQWITGAEARANGHMQRALADMILIGRGTLENDDPQLTVRIAGLEDRSPRAAVLSASLNDIPGSARLAASQPLLLASTDDLFGLPVNDILVEGGTATAGALLTADLVDRLIVYRAPILIGDSAPGAGRLGLERLADAHGRWRLLDTRPLGDDRMEVYERVREA